MGCRCGKARYAIEGTLFEPVNNFKSNSKKLARRQGEMWRKVKFSNNWKKAKYKVQKIHFRITHIRHEYLHNASTTLSKNHALIVIEDLKVKKLVNTNIGIGMAVKPQRNVKAKSALNRSILGQAGDELRRPLAYKQGGEAVRSSLFLPAYTRQKCACCGRGAKENRLSQSSFVCRGCGGTANADINAACNILAAGHAVLARGGRVQPCPPMKQDPNEVSQAVA